MQSIIEYLLTTNSLPAKGIIMGILAFFLQQRPSEMGSVVMKCSGQNLLNPVSFDHVKVAGRTINN